MMTLITGFTCPPTIYFKFITKCDSFFITKCDKCYYKVRQVLLQSAADITKCDNFITKCGRYYRQSATIITRCDSTYVTLTHAVSEVIIYRVLLSIRFCVYQPASEW